MSKSLAEGLNEFYAAQKAAPRGGRHGSSLVGFKRQKSNALRVNPQQREEAMQDATAKGVPTAFDDEGMPVFESRSHRKRYFKAYGFFDRDAGYGDQAPTHSSRRQADPAVVEAIREMLGR